MFRVTTLQGSLFILIGLFVASACESPVAHEESPVVHEDPLLRAVIDMGFNALAIEDHGDFFVVEGDIRIEKDDLVTHPAPRDTLDVYFQWATDALVSQSTVDEILIDVSGLDSGWDDAARTAAVAWTDVVGSRITLVEGGAADISMFMDAGIPTIAMATFPSGGDPGHEIRVNPNFNHFSSSEKILVMAHEIGHTLGFRHTNWNTSTCDFEGENPHGANLIGETPEADAESIMNCHVGGSDWSGFSFWDEEATRVLYNDAISLDIGPSADGDVLLEWNSVGAAIGYEITEAVKSCHPDFGCWSQDAVLDTVTTTNFEHQDTKYGTFDECDGEHWYEVRVLFEGGMGRFRSNEAHNPVCA